MEDVSWAMFVILVTSMVGSKMVQDTWAWWELEEGYIYPLGCAIGVVIAKVVT